MSFVPRVANAPIMLSVVMLNVVAPFYVYNKFFQQSKLCYILLKNSGVKPENSTLRESLTTDDLHFKRKKLNHFSWCHNTQHNDIQNNDTQHNDVQHNNKKMRRSALRHSILTPSDVMLSIAIKSFMLNVVMPNVVAPTAAVVRFKPQALG
jgi:hypothetical protein